MIVKLSYLAYPTNRVQREQMMIEIGAIFVGDQNIEIPIFQVMKSNGVTTTNRGDIDER